MKFSKLFVVGMTACAALMASCSNNSDSDSQVAAEEGAGVIKISLAGDPLSRAAGPASSAQENKVNKFIVYIFNAENGALEKSQPVSGATTTTISGISTGFPKKVVVVANVPTTFPLLEEGDDISKLENASINLTYQTPASIGTNGLVMMGETDQPVVMSLTGTTTVDIKLRRLVAKVTLGEITLVPTGDYSIDNFEITGVSIQRAISSTDIWGNRAGSASLFGGVVGSMSLTEQTFLYDALSLPAFTAGVEQEIGNYFYVLPNSVLKESTLLTLHSTYKGDPQFYPIPINTEIGSGNDTTDGTMILSNKSYVINITVNNLGEGTTDPDIPPTDAQIDVNLEVENWDLDIIQNVIW